MIFFAVVIWALVIGPAFSIILSGASYGRLGNPICAYYVGFISGLLFSYLIYRAKVADPANEKEKL